MAKKSNLLLKRSNLLQKSCHNTQSNHVKDQKYFSELYLGCFVLQKLLRDQEKALRPDKKMVCEE